MSQEPLTQEDKLRRLTRLIDLYAQSRSLPLAIPLAVIVLNVALLVGVMELARLARGWWTLAVLVLVLAWVLFFSNLVMGKLLARFAPRMYRQDGVLVVEGKRIPRWAWVAYAVTFCGPAVLCVFELLAARWALTISLASFGCFILYIGAKTKEKVLGTVLGALTIVEAAATLCGVPPVVPGRYEFFLTLMAYICGAALVTLVAVHLYNRLILRRIRGAGPFGSE